MRQIEELAVTTTGTSQMSEIAGKIWLEQVIAYAQADLYLLDFVRKYDDLVGTPNIDLVVPKTTSASVTLTLTKTEGSTRTMTEMDNLDTVALTPAGKHGGIEITKELVDRSRVAVIEEAKRQIAYYYAKQVDNDIRNALIDGTGNTIYGGDATGTTDIAAGDIMTTALFVKARRLIKANNFKPDVCVIGAEQEEAFLNDSQFVNAAEYGSDKIIKNGEIGTYLNVKVLVSTEGAKSESTYGGSPGSTAGHICMMWDSRHAVALAWKEKPAISTEWKPDERKHKIYIDMMYAASAIHGDSITLMIVADA